VIGSTRRHRMRRTYAVIMRWDSVFGSLLISKSIVIVFLDTLI
jgi:hypothetical protein